MSKNPTALKKSGSVASTKTFKLFAVFFHGPDLEQLGDDIAKNLEEIGQQKKMLAIRIQRKDNNVEREKQKIPIPTVYSEIQIGIDKCRKRFDMVSTIKWRLLDDLKLYWSNELQDMQDDIKNNSAYCGCEEEMFDETPQNVEIFPKKLKSDDMQVLYDEINDNGINTCDYFIILFGDVQNDTLLELMKNNIPLQAIIHFVQCPESDIELYFPETYNEIDFWKRSPITKNVGIFVESWMPPSVYLEEIYSQTIFDQFISYLYDIELLNQQFPSYQTDFLEINDTPSAIQEKLQLNDYTSSIYTSGDITAVSIYLDNLCTKIEEEEPRRNSCLHLRPFLKNNYKLIIVEEANKLVKSAIASKMNMVYYWRVANIMGDAMSEITKCATNEIDIQLPRYYELLSWESFVQRIDAEKIFYDKFSQTKMGKKCLLCKFQRTLNKVVEVKKKFTLPTKLCFRDFCSYVAPELADILRWHKAQMEDMEDDDGEKRKELPKFYGLSIDDTFQELTVIDKVYRFENGFIRCSLANWMYKERQLTIEIRLEDCIIYAHRWENYTSKYPRVRLITRKNIDCTVDINDTANLSILWPNDCQIRYLYEDGVQAVEQMYSYMKNNEIKRLFTPAGCVIIYLKNGIIKVLTPNGIIYVLYPRDFIDEQLHDHMVILRPLVGIRLDEEINFVKSLEVYGIKCEIFDVTKTDGKLLRVSDEFTIEEKDHFLTYEWVDYNENEWYAERDDGVRMVWSQDDFKCYYPCGTVITTTAVENYITMSYGCLNKSTEEILKKINPTLVDKVAKKSTTNDVYITYDTHYLMQHKNYASIAFHGESKLIISSPDEMEITLNKDTVIIDIGEKLIMRISSGVCTISSNAKEYCFLRLDLHHDADEILSFGKYSALLTLLGSGEMKLINEHEAQAPLEEELYFLAKRYKFGLAFLSKNMYRDIIREFKDKMYFYDSPSKTVLFEPIFPIDEQFSMPISTMEKNLKKFEIGCTSNPKKTVPKMEGILTARTIHKLKRIPKTVCGLVEGLQFTDLTLGNQIEEALDHFLGEKTKPRYSPEWTKKIENVRKDIDFKTKRRGIYNKMLRNNIFPKYHDFEACNGDIGKYDVNKLKPRLD